MDLGKARRRVESMLREIWPEAPFIILPNAGHYAQAEAHDTFVAMIKQFGNENCFLTDPSDVQSSLETTDRDSRSNS